MSIFSEALLLNKTIKSTTTATINGDQVGAVNFEAWKNALEKAVPALYNYARETDNRSHSGNGETVNTQPAQIAIKDLIDLIGEVNGYKLLNTENLVKSMAQGVTALKSDYAGEAETVANELKCQRAVRKTLNFNGVNPELVAATDARIAELDERLNILKKQAGSANTYKTMIDVKSKTHRHIFEMVLATIIDDQRAKTAEQIEAERAADRAAKKARHAAQRAADKAAKKSQTQA